MADIAIDLYRELRKHSRVRKMEHWHASIIAQCPRAQYLARLETPITNHPSGAKILRWAAGHLIEEVIRPHLKTLMPELTSNQRLTSGILDLTGEYDNYDPVTATLWEVKSVGPRAVRYRRKDETRHNLRGDGPYLSHEWQQHAYVILLGEEGIAVNRIGYLYITLEGLLVPYVTRVSDGLISDVLDRVALLKTHWDKQTLPECVCHNQDDPLYKGLYQWCDYLEPNGTCCGVEAPEPVKEKVEEAV